MQPDVEIVVIGAGVIGLAVADRLARAGHGVIVLERHDRTGAETSSRNSEVIHAGLYYPPGSLRARTCVRGKHLLYRLASEAGVSAVRCGKLVVAATPAEIDTLHAMMANAAANGVEDLVLLDDREARALEPDLACAAAVLSPSTGVLDTHGLLTTLEGRLTACGGEVVLSSRVEGMQRLAAGHWRIDVDSGGERTSLTARHVINAAGLSASTIGRMALAGASAELGGRPAARGYEVPCTWPVKGHYFALSGPAPFRHLIYPAPSPGWPGLHLTLDVAGAAKFGPDLEYVETVDYTFDDPEGARRSRFADSIRRYWPGLPEDRLSPGYTGIRPRISGPGEPLRDFEIHGPADHGLDGFIALYGIESPGITAALALAEEVALHLTASS